MIKAKIAFKLRGVKWVEKNEVIEPENEREHDYLLESGLAYKQPQEQEKESIIDKIDFNNAKQST